MVVTPFVLFLFILDPVIMSLIFSFGSYAYLSGTSFDMLMSPVFMPGCFISTQLMGYD